MSGEFLEKVILLVISLASSGFIIPYIFREIDHRKHEEKQLFEAQIARQNKVIESQVELVNEISSLLWSYQLLLIAVPYYQQFESKDMYNSALNEYEQSAGDLLGRIRTEISKSIRLCSEQTYKDLVEFYYTYLIDVDLKVKVLSKEELPNNKCEHEWVKLHDFILKELSVATDKLIDTLAKDLGLKSKHI